MFEINLNMNLVLGTTQGGLTKTIVNQDTLPYDMRKSGHFIQLAAAGMNQCMEAGAREILEKKPKTGVFFCSGSFNYTQTREFYLGLFNAGVQTYSPIRFANSVGNSATYYILKQLGINAEVYAINQEDHSYEVGLVSACSSLASGAIDVAILGACDSLFAPADEMSRKIRFTPAPLHFGEHSSWFILKRPDGSQEKIQAVVKRIRYFAAQEFYALKTCIGDMINDVKGSVSLACSFRMDSGEKAEIFGQFPNIVNFEYLPEMGVSFSGMAAAKSRMLESGASLILLLNKNYDGKFALTEIVRQEN